MRARLVFSLTTLVAAVHWLLLFGPGAAHLFPAVSLPDAPQRLATTWVTLPPVLPAPAVAPTPPAASPPVAPSPVRPRAAKRAPRPPVPKPVAAPVTVATPAAIPILASATTGEDSSAPDVISQSEVPRPETALVEPETLAPPPAPEARPSLQVHDNTGTPVAIALPADGSALHQQMQLHFRVHGWVKGMEYHAQATLEWRTEGSHYEARQSIRAFLLGSMEQTSVGQLTAQGLQPLQFTDRRFAKRRSVHWDWAAQQATFDPVREAVAIGPGAQDRLSVFLQLAALLQVMPELRAPGTRIDIPTLGSRRLQRWTFVVEQEEALELPAGTLPTLRLQRLPQAGDAEQAWLWVNPAQGYVPARIRMHERNGDVMELSLQSAT